MICYTQITHFWYTFQIKTLINKKLKIGHHREID